MKLKNKIAYLAFLACFVTNTHATADTIPIPPKRPAVMNVSPAFIEELKNRDKQNHEPKKAEEKKDKARGPLPLPANKKMDRSGKTELVDLKPKDLLDILDGTKEAVPKTEKPKTIASVVRKARAIPIPKHKPTFLNYIEPAAQGDQNTTLVSFVLKPEQIKLDQNIEFFLQEHALKLFHDNKGMKMEIQAYATPIEGEQHSDVRISLARALEVRSFLIKNNIAASRLKLTPMGHDVSNDNDNRIDLLFMSSE